MTARKTHLAWQDLSRLAGLTIVAVLLALFVVGFFAGIALDTPVTLAFLTIASGLIGLPSGVQLVLRRNGNGGPPS